MDMPGDLTHQGRIEGWLLRGGTSKGLFVRSGALPSTHRDELILELFGSPDPLQVDGVGGSHSHTSKLMVVGPSDASGIDVEYTFGQVGIEKPVVDWGGNCGNLTSAIGVFAMLEGLVPATAPETELRLYNTNTDTVVEQTIPVDGGEPAVYGDFSIDGVPGTGARIDSRFRDPAGGVTGALFPTGQVTEPIVVGGDECMVSIVDVANPNVFVRANDLGLTGTELPADMAAQPAVLERLEQIRAIACERIGLVEEASRASEESPGVPFVAVVADPASYDCSIGRRVTASEIDVTARMISNGQPHHAYAMTGAICLAAATRLPGTVPAGCIRGGNGAVSIGHPKGTMTVGVETVEDEGEPVVESVTVARTARPLMRGSVYYRYVGDLATFQSLADASKPSSD